MIKKVAWMHHPINDMNADTLANEVIKFHESYSFEFVKVSTNSNSICDAFGIKRLWNNNQYGSYEKNTIVYDPHQLLQEHKHLSSIHDFALLSQNIIAHENISSQIKKPIYATIYSPLYHLKSMLGNKITGEDIDKYRGMLDFLTEITKEYITKLQEITNTKIYYCVFFANHHFCTHETFQRSVIVYDKKCIDKINGNDNILHFHACQDFIEDYIQLSKFKFISSDIATKEFIDSFLEKYPSLFFIGGINHHQYQKSSDLINNLNDLKNNYHNKNFIIGPNCTLPINIEPNLLKIIADYE